MPYASYGHYCMDQTDEKQSLCHSVFNDKTFPYHHKAYKPHDGFVIVSFLRVNHAVDIEYLH